MNKLYRLSDTSNGCARKFRRNSFSEGRKRRAVTQRSVDLKLGKKGRGEEERERSWLHFEGQVLGFKGENGATFRPGKTVNRRARNVGKVLETFHFFDCLLYGAVTND